MAVKSRLVYEGLTLMDRPGHVRLNPISTKGFDQTMNTDPALTSSRAGIRHDSDPFASSRRGTYGSRAFG